MMKIALIGCGRISFKHIEAFVAMQDKVALVAVCDPIVERAEEKKAEYGKSVPNAPVNRRLYPLQLNLVSIRILQYTVYSMGRMLSVKSRWRFLRLMHKR